MRRLVVLALLASLTFAAYPNLQLWYRAQDTTGVTTTRDCSGNGRNGTISGSKVCATARGQQCWYFDGTGDYVVTPSFGLSGTVTIFACWVRCKDNAAIQSFIGEWDGGQPQVYIQRQNGTNALWVLYGGDIRVAANFFATPYNDVWLHLCVVSDYTGKYCYVYRNGTLFYSSAISGTPVFPPKTQARYIGAYGPNREPVVDGYLANVQLWTLPTMPPLAVMNASVARIAAGLMPCW